MLIDRPTTVQHHILGIK